MCRRRFSANEGQTTMPTFSESSESTWEAFSSKRSGRTVVWRPKPMLSIARRSVFDSRVEEGWGRHFRSEEINPHGTNLKVPQGYKDWASLSSADDAKGKSLLPGGVEISELEGHPFYLGTQYHPEFRSRPNRPHPLFVSFIQTALEYARANGRAEARVPQLQETPA